MRLIFASSAALLALTGALGAQQTASTSAPERLDEIAAVVGDQPITYFELREVVLGKLQNKEVPAPTSRADTLALEHSVLQDMIDEELLLQKAKDLKIEIADADVTPVVDRRMRDTRSQFSTEAEYRQKLAEASLGTPEDFRKYWMDLVRRQMTIGEVTRKLQQSGKIFPVNVTDAEVQAAFIQNKAFIDRKPASVTFRQVVIAPKPDSAEKAAARARADSLLAQLKSGMDFELLAKRESMDPRTKETGGDLGWIRRGPDNFPEFERWLFGTPYYAPLTQGQYSAVVETAAGFHILRMDRVQPGEVKAHQIFVAPKIDSADVQRTRVLADSVAELLKKGASFDTLAKKYNDYAGHEETNFMTPFWRDSLPISYQRAFTGKKAADISVFQIASTWPDPSVPKYVVAQLASVDEGGEPVLDDRMKSVIRADLAQRGGVRRYEDTLRKQTFVAILIDKVPANDQQHP